MTRTAIGLLENQASANEVVREIQALGFSPDEIRILSEPLDMPVTGVLSTPGTDFSVALGRDLREIGATEAEARAYSLGVQQGGVLVFATGSGEQVDSAAGIMNQHKAGEVQELIGQEPVLPNVGPGSGSPIASVSALSGKIRYSGEGARIFVW